MTSDGQPALHRDIATAFSLAGRTAVVTGAGGGLGRETAVTYSKAGATVLIADRSLDGLAGTEALVAAVGAIPATVVPTDVTDPAAVDSLARVALDRTGRLDVWANVAGVIANSNIVDITPEHADAIIDVNMKGMLWGVASAAKVMSTAKRGSIINVSAAAGELPVPTLAVYGMTKAAILHLTTTAAAELGPLGIRVNSVSPGFVETPMTRRSWVRPDGSVDVDKRAETIAMRSQVSPLNIIGEPSDVGLAMLYLASDASRFVTGQAVRPNGGCRMA